MKKFFLFLLSAAVVSAATAQNVAIGIKGGANLTKIDGMKFKEGFNTSYQAGGFLEVDFTDKFGLQTEVLFSQSKVRQDTSLSQVIHFNHANDIKLDYLAIPVLLRYHVSKLVTLHIGPQFGILINKNDNLLTNGQQAFKNGDFSLLGGVQLNLSSFRIYGRYNIGLSNISDVGNSQKWKYQQIQLGIGFKVL